MNNETASIINRLTAKYYKDGYTVSDVCSSIRMHHDDILFKHDISDAYLFNRVLAYLECNTQITKANKR